MSREVMQQALEAIRIFREWEMWRDFDSNRDTVLSRAFAAEEALEAALAEPVQEPVAWRVQRSDGQYELYFVKASAERAAECYIKRPQVEPLYTHPAPQRQPLTGDDYAGIYEYCADWDDFAREVQKLERKK